MEIITGGVTAAKGFKAAAAAAEIKYKGRTDMPWFTVKFHVLRLVLLQQMW